MADWDVTTAAASLEFDTRDNSFNSCFQIDSNHFINFWLGGAATTDGFTQVFTVNTSTWAVTTAAASKLFSTDVGTYNTCYQIDSNHFINFWRGVSSDGFVQTFTVNTSTWAVTTAAAVLEFDTQNYIYGSVAKIDTNHFILFYLGSTATQDNHAQTFTVNTTTWAVTTAAARFLFDTDVGTLNSCFQIDANHFINFWQGVAADGFVQTFTVDTTTWAVTTAAAPLEFDTQQGSYHSCYQIDSNHFIDFWLGGAATTDGFVQTFTVNTTTWDVTTAAASLQFETDTGSYNSCRQIDANHFINFWTGPGADGFTQVFTVNTTTWAVTTAAASLEFDTQSCVYNSCFQIDANHFINFWQGFDTDGFVQVFTVELPASSAIKSINGLAKASVKSINGLAIASVKNYNGLA